MKSSEQIWWKFKIKFFTEILCQQIYYFLIVRESGEHGLISHVLVIFSCLSNLVRSFGKTPVWFMLFNVNSVVHSPFLFSPSNTKKNATDNAIRCWSQDLNSLKCNGISCNKMALQLHVSFERIMFHFIESTLPEW